MKRNISPKINLFQNDRLFFIHIPKAAGTTFIGILDTSFLIKDICPIHWPYEKLIDEISNENLAQYRFIRGHFPYSLVERLPQKPTCITLLREPVIRTISEFEQLQKEPLHRLNNELRHLSLEETLDRPHLFGYLVNKATRYLGGEPTDVPLWEQKPNLNLAIERLHQIDFFGIVEHFADSLKLFCNTFDIPPIEEFENKNINPNREKRKEIPQHVVDKLTELNREDIDLYNYALKLFQERLTSLSKGEETATISTPLADAVEFNFRLVPPGAGWHVGELHPSHGPIRWSGPNTVSTLNFDLKRGVDFKIRFNILNSAAIDILESLSLYVNGVPVTIRKINEELAGQIIYEGIFSNSLAGGSIGSTRIEFKVNRTTYPSETNISNPDKRLLGLCYNWLQISRVGEVKETMENIAKKNRQLRQPLNEDEQLFFMHIPKTAGTSLIAVLDQRYTVDEICPLDRGTQEQYLSLQENDRLRYKFIRGHFPYSLVNRLRNPRTLTFLRDPVRRTLSAINHHKRLEEQGLSFFKDIRLAELTLEEFLDHPVLGNFVANKALDYLNDRVGLHPPGSPPPDLSLAKERLETFDFIGFTERFDDSLELLAYTFGFSPIQGYQTLQSAPREKREEVPQYLLDRLTDMNRDEIELYQYGLKLFEERLGQMKTEQVAAPVEIQQHMGGKEIFHDMRRINPGRGWHVGEPHPVYGVVRWSGPETVSYLDLPLQVERDFIVRFRVLASITPEVLNSLKLEINGQKINLDRRADGSHGAVIFEGRIPHSVLKNSEALTTLVFTVSQTHQPGEFQAGNADERKLGLCYNWLHIYPE